MSIIVWDGKTLASDRAMWICNIKHKVQKIHKIEFPGIQGSYLIGGIGTAAFVSAGFKYFRSGFQTEFKPDYKEYDDIKASEYYFIVINETREIFFYDGKFNSFCILDEKIALGGASEVAIGALDAGATAREAVEICIRRTDYAGLGVDEISF